MPREGGNLFKLSFYGTEVTPAFQANNYTTELQSLGLTSPNKLKEAYDYNGSGGGPIVKDKLWFFGSLRRQLNQTYQAGLYYNLNAGDATKWSYAPDLSNQAYFSTLQPGGNLRGTWQPTPRNKFSLSLDVQPRDVLGDRANTSPESANEFKFNSNRIITGGWSSPVTNRLLLDARLTTHGEVLYNSVWPTDPNDPYRSLIAVTEQGGSIPGLLYRGAGQAAGPTFIFAAMSAPNIWEFKTSATYVTGSHALKFGFDDSWGRQYLLEQDINSATSYRFNNGVPNQITERASPVSRYDDLKAELGMYIQDRWTIKKLTLTGGLRFDYFNTYFPATPLGPGPLVPTRNFTITPVRVGRLEGSDTAHVGGLRSVRERQDRGQGQPRALRARRRQHGRQRLLGPCQHRDPIVDPESTGGKPELLHPAVQSPEPVEEWRLWRDLGYALRHPRFPARPTIRTCSTAGGSAATTGSSRPASSSR